MNLLLLRKNLLSSRDTLQQGKVSIVLCINVKFTDPQDLNSFQAYAKLAPDYMKIPSDKKEWQKIIYQNNSRWQFPNCYAAADGKHVGIICPPYSGSEFYDCKGFYSIELLAFVDYDYKFLVAEIGCHRKISHGESTGTPPFICP